MRVDELGPELAAQFRQRIRALLEEHPGWTERELTQAIMRDLGDGTDAYSHPTVLRALRETDPQRARQMIDADAAAMDALLSAELAPMILEVAREQ